MLIEKPMCFSVPEGQAMIAAAERAGVTLMVAYNKRYDPAYRRFAEEAGSIAGHPPRAHHHAGSAVPALCRALPAAPAGRHCRRRRTRRFAADNAARIAAAIGDVDPLSAHAYHLVLLDSLVHEFNAMRGVLGEPDQLTFADITEHGITAVLRFGATQCVLTWVDLPGIARYAMEFAFYAPQSRLTLAFPSPFLRSAPTLLTREGGETRHRALLADRGNHRLRRKLPRRSWSISTPA